jgi:hypothetical protein
MIDFLSSKGAVLKRDDEEKTAFNTDLGKLKSIDHVEQIETPVSLASLTKFSLPTDNEGTDLEEELEEEEEEAIDSTASVSLKVLLPNLEGTFVGHCLQTSFADSPSSNTPLQ